MPEEVSVADNTLSFEVSSRHVCPIDRAGTGIIPTPPARPIPRKPRQGPTPTAAPLESPNPYHVTWNNTHVVVVNWEGMEEPNPLRIDQDMQIGDKYWTIHTEWNSWKLIPCPPRHDCPVRMANLWECWFDEDFQPYCHSVALRTEPGSHVEFVAPGHFDSGLHMYYQGTFGARMLINATCDRSHSARTVSIARSIVRYQNINNWDEEFSFASSAAYVCPHPFQPIEMPTEPRPPYPRDASQKFTIGAFVGGKHVGLNLKKFAMLTGTAVTGSDVSYHRAEFHYSPAELVPCPRGRNCGVYAKEKANVWKCIRTNFHDCYPIGDMRYGLSLTFISMINPLSGISATYDGGAGGASVQFDFQCNRSVLFGQVWIHPLAIEDEDHTIVVWAHTPEVCPGNEWGQIRPGACVILVFLVLFIVYFVAGTLVMFVLHGSVDLPQARFWEEVGASLWTAVLFLISCGKTSAPATATYDV
jgi:hypothetical protein